jgi:hypothetical protein
VRVVGEVYEVDGEALENLDEYEGVSKGYYCRVEVEVEVEGVGTLPCFVYKHAWGAQQQRGAAAPMAGAGGTQPPAGLAVSGEAPVVSSTGRVLALGPFLSEYTPQVHRDLYKPIHHILAKQLPYLSLDSTLT